MVKEETHNQKVVSLCPSAGYWMDIFLFILIEKTENKWKRGRVGTILKFSAFRFPIASEDNF